MTSIKTEHPAPTERAGDDVESKLIERVSTESRPMLYITTRSSDRASSIASLVKASLEQVRSFLQDNGIAPAGDPMAIFSDWNGRLVAVEAGFPVNRDDAALASGRIQAGETPDGPAARVSYRTAPGTQQRRQEEFAEALRAAGLRTTGTMWEVYVEDSSYDGGRTDLFAQLLDDGGLSAR